MTGNIDAASPGERYAAGVAAGNWQDDPAQRAVLPALDRLWRELAQDSAPSLWSRLRGAMPASPRGLYLWGRVGRGKTFLTELFCEALTTPRKRRVHFHRFMQDIHARLRLQEACNKVIGLTTRKQRQALLQNALRADGHAAETGA